MVSTIQDFRFTSDSKSVFENFTIIDDDVLEFDELFIAEFDFGHEILNSWNARKEEPSIAYILIRDDDCEWHVQLQDKALYNYITYPITYVRMYVNIESLHKNNYYVFNCYDFLPHQTLR